MGLNPATAVSGIVLDVTAYCICEIHWLALNGFNLNAVHKLRSKEKKLLAELGFEPGAGGWEARMLPLCYAAPLQNQSRVNAVLLGHSGNAA